MPLSISRDRLLGLLERAKDRRVTGIGGAMLDGDLRGDVERISPEAPVPVVRVRERRYALGGAANVAQNVAAIGAACDLVAAIGNDTGGETLRSMMSAIDADSSSLVVVRRPTTTKTRIVARAQQVVRVDEEEDVDLQGDEVERVFKAVDAAIQSAHAVVLEDYNKGVLVPRIIEEAIRAARRRDLPVVVDPKYKNFFVYRGAT